MELEELKQKWNRIDEGLSKNESYSSRMFAEIIKGKTQTKFDKIYKGAMFNLFVTLFVVVVVIPIQYVNGIFHNTTLWILEGVCVLGLLMIACRLYFISQFDVMKTPQNQLRNLVNYKRCYIYEAIIGLPLAIIAICITLYLENTASPQGIFYVAIGFFTGIVCAWIGWKKHKSTMNEIEHHLSELKELGR